MSSRTEKKQAAEHKHFFRVSGRQDFRKRSWLRMACITTNCSEYWLVEPAYFLRRKF